MMTPKATDVKKGIALLWETLQCPICLDLMTTPVSTKCDHQFCKFCITKLLDNSKQNGANCPVCKSKITKRSLQESLGFQRLVAGLQDMIQAYEHDTCTNYFTGQPRGNKNFTNALKSKNVCDLSSGHTIGTQPDNKGNLNRDDSPQSCSSTVAAQNGFAQLMGLEDSAENEGLDSGLGDIPPTSDKKMSGSTDDFELETADVAKNSKPTCSAKNKKSSVKPEKSKPNQEESDQRHIRKSSRKKQKQDLEPDKILEQKKKKSLEKVARWLLKVPAEDELEVDDDLPNAADSYSCSSTSTLDVNMRDVALNPTREDRAKALEEQVFGAIYKRSGGKRTTAEETKTCKRLSKWRKKSNVGVCEERQMVSEQTAVDEKLDKTVDRLSESCTNQAEHEVPVADDVQPDMTATKRSVKAREIDCDLHEPTLSRSKGTREKSNGRKGKKSKLTIRKPTKLAIPLVLVGVQSRETSPKPSERAKEVEVQIETYPSSEEQTTPVMRSSRRSRRLQLFVEEVQGCNKKTPSRSCATEADKGGDKLTDVANDKSVDATLPQSGILTKGDQRNGCVFEEDIGGIESMEKSRETYLRQAEAEVPEAQALALPDADLTVSVVPNTTSQSDPSAIGPTLESERQENNCPSDFQPETCVDEAKRAAEECEDGKNDGELDTEQLLRSFKAAKRKSFLLGAPNTKRSRGSDEDDASSQLTENINQVANGSDVISPSHSPSQIRKPFQARLEASGPNSDSSGQELDAENCLTRSSFSSGLSPNKVSKRDRESPLSVVPQVVDSDLRFTAVDHGASRGPQITDGQSDSNLKEITDGISKCPSVSQAKAMFIEESSLTPDDLGIHEVNGGVGNQSSIKSNPGRRRRAQRLESLSGSDSSGSKEDLPTLAQIFGTLDRPHAEIKPQGKLGETTRLEDVAAEVLGGPPGSPSPDRLDSSQASVDLFGTPDECDAPEKDASVLFESSQFSSEVLVTQQKVEMQQELVRLEKLMALVSEVLQEKEGSPPREVASDTDQDCNKGGPDTHTSLLNDQDQVPSSDRRERPPDDKVTTEPEVGKHGSVSDAAVHHSTHAGLHIKDIKSPNSMPATKTVKHCDSLPDGQEDKENNSPPKEKSKAKLVLVSSGLGPSEQTMVKKFAKRVGGRVVSQVTPEVTHIIMRTDDQLVCERTLKYFLGIAGRKWVVSFQWISECFKDKKLLEESSFEVRGDVVNGPNHQGPSRARTTADCNLLMKGYKICFKGPFTDMSTDEMEWMVELCGATVVKEPILLDEKQKSQQIVIVQPRSECSSSSYSSLSRKATVVTRGWLLDTVATYKLQNYSNYTV